MVIHDKAEKAGSKMKGMFYGVGVGPGDPELLTLKAVKTIEAAHMICFIANQSGYSMALDIAKQFVNPSQQQYPIKMEMSNNRCDINQAYDQAASDIGDALKAGKHIVMLCEGDPLFYGSFIYLHQRLKNQFQTQIVPGINAINASAAQSQTALCSLSHTKVTLTARNSDLEILSALKMFDCVAILKAGRERQRLVSLIKSSGRIADTVYVERATHDNEVIYHQLGDIPATPGDYFSLFLCSRETLENN